MLKEFLNFTTLLCVFFPVLIEHDLFVIQYSAKKNIFCFVSHIIKVNLKYCYCHMTLFIFFTVQYFVLYYRYIVSNIIKKLKQIWALISIMFRTFFVSHLCNFYILLQEEWIAQIFQAGDVEKYGLSTNI